MFSLSNPITRRISIALLVTFVVASWLTIFFSSAISQMNVTMTLPWFASFALAVVMTTGVTFVFCTVTVMLGAIIAGGIAALFNYW